MASGRVNALLVATRHGQVVYERFYDSFSEAEKAEIRAEFDQVAGPSSGAAGAADDEELVGRFRCPASRLFSGSGIGSRSVQFKCGGKGCKSMSRQPMHDAACHQTGVAPGCRNGRIVCVPSGDLLFFALGTGEYNELACERGCLCTAVQRRSQWQMANWHSSSA